jgi:hypothetical protein
MSETPTYPAPYLGKLLRFTFSNLNLIAIMLPGQEQKMICPRDHSM